MSKLEKFRELGLSEDIIDALTKKGFEEPTPIQAKTIPYLISGTKDLIGKAQTGTGKTGAFGLPLIQNINPNGKIQALILAPTRELAIQVTEEISSYCVHKKLAITPVYGGQPIDRQISRLKRGVDIVVGTPGRIIDHIERGTMDISKVSYVILDEADEMLNMGFVEDIESILESTPKSRRTILFSATMPKHIQNLAKNYMKEYEVIEIDAKQVAKKNIRQIYFEVTERDKFEALFRVIDLEESFYGMVFCRTKVDTDEIAAKLSNRGLRAEPLHGDLSQGQREKILGRFRTKKINVLVATDVAARGIDVDDLTHVVNYAIPQDPESYVHRIGRTGRAGKDGTAITFVTPSEYRKLNIIERVANATITKEKLPNVAAIIEGKKQRIKNSIFDIVNAQSLEDLNLAKDLIAKISEQNFEDLEDKNIDVKTRIIAALIKLYGKNEFDESNYQEISEGRKPVKSGSVKLFFAQGRNHNLSPQSLAETVSLQTGVEANKLSDVRILDDFSFFVADAADAEVILDYFKNNSNDGRSLVSKAKDKPSSGGGGGGRSDFRRNDDRRDGGFRRGGFGNSGRNDNRRDSGERRGGFGGERRGFGGGNRGPRGYQG